MHTRDFLPDDVSELSSVAAVEDAVGADAGGGAIVLVVVVVVVRIGCRQQDEEDTDVDVVAVTVAAAAASSVLPFDAAAAEDADVTVFVDSFQESAKASPLNHLIRIMWPSSTPCSIKYAATAVQHSSFTSLFRSLLLLTILVHSHPPPTQPASCLLSLFPVG